MSQFVRKHPRYWCAHCKRIINTEPDCAYIEPFPCHVCGYRTGHFNFYYPTTLLLGIPRRLFATVHEFLYDFDLLIAATELVTQGLTPPPK